MSKPIIVDFGEGVDVIPEGDYIVQVVKAQATVAKTSGNDMIKWQFRVVEPEAYAGKMLWDNTVLIESAIWKLIQLMTALGFSTSELKGEQPLSLSDYVGLTCSIRVEHEMRDGEKRESISRYRKAGGATGAATPF